MPPNRSKQTGKFVKAQTGTGPVTTGYAYASDNNFKTNTGVAKFPVTVPNTLILDRTTNTYKGTGRVVQWQHKK